MQVTPDRIKNAQSINVEFSGVLSKIENKRERLLAVRPSFFARRIRFLSNKFSKLKCRSIAMIERGRTQKRVRD